MLKARAKKADDYDEEDADDDDQCGRFDNNCENLGGCALPQSFFAHPKVSYLDMPLLPLFLPSLSAAHTRDFLPIPNPIHL